MKRSSTPRRVPRKIGQDDDAAADGTPGNEAVGSAIRRPKSTPKKPSGLRTSLGSNDEDDNDTAGVITPKRSALSRIAVQRAASQRSSFLASSLAADDDATPSYTPSDLSQLRASTPSTPQPTSTDLATLSSATQTLDLTSKFGSSLSRYASTSSAIPSVSEIAEKKARRARLAAESQADEFISLDPDDPFLNPASDDDAITDPNVTKDASGRLILAPKDKYAQAESRLVRDDEDVMEGFEEFTGEGGNRINMGESALPQDLGKRKQDIAAQIAAAEGDESDSSADSSGSRDRLQAFEAAQTAAGTFSSAPASAYPARPATPPRISPLPSLDAVVLRLKAQMADMRRSHTAKLIEIENLQREKDRIGQEEVRIQAALKDTAEKFEALRAEKGVGNGEGTREGTPTSATGLGMELGKLSARGGIGASMLGRGLESLGGTPVGMGTPVGVGSGTGSGSE
ncbi:hypothetical protein B0A48_16010 [Cryoendolithus antarcticus]|uniref:Uncharacterized protein n=1 Tax=Cryoendolithus antarcticus TaxID=1507870 RepID=A0A1V8SFD5_9PEZI|nr:hypothetical protein B0A48_16010 [Cryoendolithus antarcticus]